MLKGQRGASVRAKRPDFNRKHVKGEIKVAGSPQPNATVGACVLNGAFLYRRRQLPPVRWTRDLDLTQWAFHVRSSTLTHFLQYFTPYERSSHAKSNATPIKVNARTKKIKQRVRNTAVLARSSYRRCIFNYKLRNNVQRLIEDWFSLLWRTEQLFP